MNNKGDIEWRIIWLIAVIAGLIVMTIVIVALYYAQINTQSPFSLFSNIFGGGG